MLRTSLRTESKFTKTYANQPFLSSNAQDFIEELDYFMYDDAIRQIPEQ